ncbi:MAG TPA: hypothetical protein PKN36_02525 [bacterium]|nr:hypothetical protein [bacterium]
MLRIKAKIFISMFILSAVCASAYWEWTPEKGRWINPKYAVKDTAKEQFLWAEQLRREGELEKSINEHRKLIKHFPESEYAPESCYILGETYRVRGDIKESFIFYEKIAEDYPGSPRVFDAIKMKLEMAEKRMEGSSFQLFKGKAKEKGEMLAGVLEKYPYFKEADEKSLQLGKFYLDIKEYKMAKDVFLKLADNTMNAEVREEASFYLVKAEYLSVSGATTDTEGLKRVKERINRFNALYSESKHVEEILDIKNKLDAYEAKKYFEIASYYEKAGKKKAADYYFRIIAENYPETEYGKISLKKVGPAD